MQLAQWNPFREMDELLARVRAPLRDASVSEWAPAVDITETGKEYLVQGELPGLKKDDVKVEVANGVLTISGERRFESEDKNEKRHRIERAYGSFTRSFALPDDVAAEKIGADFHDGVIKVHLPKTDLKKSAATRIQVR